MDHSGHSLRCALISLGDLPVLWIPDVSAELKFMSRRLHVGLELLLKHRLLVLQKPVFCTVQVYTSCVSPEESSGHGTGSKRAE